MVVPNVPSVPIVSVIPVVSAASTPNVGQAPDEVLARYLRPGTLRLQTLPPLSLYVHLPWCLKKCPYCDFNSHEQRGELPQAAYLAALLADLEAALPFIWGRRIHSIFIGGGTPSLFSAASIGQLIADIRARLPLEPGLEITMEANPGTFETDRYHAYRQAGITRLSIGVQSFNDVKLQALGRVHDAAQARAAVAEASAAFDTFNLDLMYALPGQTLAELQDDLQQALAFKPPHLSIYHLTLEPNTYFAVHPPSGTLALPDDDLAFDMLDLITAQTEASGLARYEVSAFAQSGHRCAHNLNYWNFGDYLGIGAGAHSKLSFPHRVVRQTRYREPARYMAQAAAGFAVSSDAEVSRAELPFEFMLNALRLRDGFALARFAERTGLALTSIQTALVEAERQGFIERDFAWLKPTPRGFDFLNDLVALFMAD